MLKKVIIALILSPAININCSDATIPALPLSPIAPSSPSSRTSSSEYSTPRQFNLEDQIKIRNAAYFRDAALIGLAGTATSAFCVLGHCLCCPTTAICPLIVPGATLTGLAGCLIVSEGPIRKFQEKTRAYPAYYDNLSRSPKNKRD